MSLKSGTSVLDAAREAGVGIRSECGGKKKCGKCRVVVEDKSCVNKPNDAEKAS